ncbi:cytochrome-c peroxidase [Flavobacterium crassostreae]|uniref:Cytochrome-c peroxidase n=1 Tax=Flavobacterium crassostreae TaxID=1763534 RepID=A0A1B9E821_9FLAO|nr:cytochrome c peroxidase [Flavobacterium crassostreae]OCB78083.1 cytochrome-c peroxidase [Flavobacterium crassostreae]
MKIKHFLWLVFPILINCSDSDQDAKYINLPLDFSVPSNFPNLAYDIAANPPTEKGFELGKKLFYDGRLASDGLVSCGFCHLQENAFTHHGHTVSHGVDNALGIRNAPAIQNMAYQRIYMYDGATSHLDLQPIIPLTSTVEMNGDLNRILAMMKADPNYRELFKVSFKDGAVSIENMLKALSQFMVMLTSSNSKFDHYRRNEAGGTLTKEEMAGYTIFKNKCASCHATDLMTDDSFRNNGLAINPLINDVGRYRVTEQATDYYKFKVPSLRNVAVTAPYMHDGRFGSLASVLNHYSTAVVDGATLDPILKQNGKLGITLSETDKEQLIAFLNTLTDYQYLTDKRFSEF